MAYKDFADILTNDVEPSALEVAQNLWAVISERGTRELSHKDEDDIRQRGTGSSTALQMPRMPVEILGEIFQHLVPGSLNIYTKTTVDNLCLVCKDWNDAARHTRELWARISVHVTDGFVQMVSLEKIVAWLSRAGNSPRFLEIFPEESSYIYSPKPATTKKSPSFPSTFPLCELLALCDPLYHLSFSFDDPRCFRGIFKSLRSPEARQSAGRVWDQIRSMTLLFEGGPEWNDDHMSFTFNNLPGSVTHLEVDLPGIHALCESEVSELEVELLVIPSRLLQQLTSLTISCDWEGTLNQILCVMEDCVNVEKLSISLYDPFEWSWELGWPEGDPAIKRLIKQGLTLPQLRFLRLEGLTSAVTRIFEFLDAPSLVALELYGAFKLNPEFHGRLDKLMRRRSQYDTTLLHLTLELLTSNFDEDLSSLHSAIPELKDLTQLSLRRIWSEDEDEGPEEDVFKALCSPQTLPPPKNVEIVD